MVKVFCCLQACCLLIEVVPHSLWLYSKLLWNFCLVWLERPTTYKDVVTHYLELDLRTSDYKWNGMPALFPVLFAVNLESLKYFGILNKNITNAKLDVSYRAAPRYEFGVISSDLSITHCLSLFYWIHGYIFSGLFCFVFCILSNQRWNLGPLMSMEILSLISKVTAFHPKSWQHLSIK